MRVKYLRDHKGHSKGSVVSVSPNEAFGLIDSGVAIISKDLTEQDYKTNHQDEEQADGKHSRKKL